MILAASKPSIAVCFYGIARSLNWTHESIEENILAPLRSLGSVTVYAHLYRQRVIANPRAKEFAEVDPDEHRYLHYDVLDLDEPDIPEVQALYADVSPWGSAWEGEMQTLSNLCHQLVSLRRVTKRALKGQHDLYVFARPDLLYHDSLGYAAAKALALPEPGLLTPYWQAHSGLNDRFCLVRGEEAARAVGLRADRAMEYCQRSDAPLPSEVFLAFVSKNLPQKNIAARASRVRVDGTIRSESFDTPAYFERISQLKRRIRKHHLRDPAIKLLRLWQALHHGTRYSRLRTLAQKSTHYSTLDHTP